MALLSLLPTPKSTFLPSDEPVPAVDYPIISTKKQPPPYGQRQGWVPRSVEDFGDGGAFPEIHVAQYPLDMGRKNKAPSNQIVPLTMDSQGNVKYDAILGHKVGTVVHSRPQDLQEKHLREEELARPDDEAVNETTLRTKQALEALVQGKIAAAQPTKVPQQSGEPTYIKYTPAQQGGAFNSGSKQRIIRLVEQPKDPLEPPKFRHKRVPGGPPSPPVPVMHSPPRKVTPKDQQDWKIPPCISNWKNAKGYTIPLDKRLAADGRGLQEVQINDNFAKLSESLYLAERNAREEVNSRAQIQKKLMQQEREKKEEMLRNLAQNAREGRVAIQSQDTEEQDEENLTMEELQAKRERDALREERRRDRERERRLEASGKKKSKLSRDEERDISEKVALGEHAPAASKETMYDQRLFNQVQGMESGFAEEDSYNVYDKPLFRGSSANALYRPPKGDDETYGGTSVESIMKTSRFKPDRDFDGAAENRKHSTEPRNKPVEFEREVEEDPFGLDEFLEEAKTAGRKPLDKIGKSGHMHASAGSSVRETESSSHSRKKIDFDSGKKSKYN